MQYCTVLYCTVDSGHNSPIIANAACRTWPKCFLQGDEASSLTNHMLSEPPHFWQLILSKCACPKPANQPTRPASLIDHPSAATISTTVFQIPNLHSINQSTPKKYPPILPPSSTSPSCIVACHLRRCVQDHNTPKLSPSPRLKESRSRPQSSA